MGIVTLRHEQAEGIAMRWLAHWVSCQECSRSIKLSPEVQQPHAGKNISNDSTSKLVLVDAQQNGTDLLHQSSGRDCQERHLIVGTHAAVHFILDCCLAKDC